MKEDFVAHNAFTLLLKKRELLRVIKCELFPSFPFLPSIFCFQGKNGADNLLVWFD